MAEPSSPPVLLPGDRLPAAPKGTSAQAVVAGVGAHEYNSSVVSSVAGILSPPSAVSRPRCSWTAAPILPYVGSIVLARVLRNTPRQSIVAILTVDNKPCTSANAANATSGSEHWQGLIRQQDIRATEKDKVKVGDSFRPGDIVRAEVISLGDQSNYYLSTARNELGVVLAKSETGNFMAPVSWNELRDTVTGNSESRKVAKPS